MVTKLLAVFRRGTAGTDDLDALAGGFRLSHEGSGVKSSTDFKLTAGLLALILAFGGAGLSHPLLAMLLQLSACGAVAYLILSPRDWRFDRLTCFALLLLALLMLLPLAQLVPLPPSVWSQLPGRELPAELDSIVGITRWRPISLDIEGTIQSFLSLVPAAAVFLCALFLPLRERARLYWIIVGFALFGAVLGVMQFATGGGLTPFPSGHSGYAIGLFVNRNHSASFSLVAMPLAAAIGAMMAAAPNRRVPSVVGVVSTLLILGIAVLATTSRMAILLLPFAILSALFLALYKQPPWKIALPSLLGVLGVGLLLLVGGGFNQTLSRFSSLDDPRLNYWTDIYWALQHYGLAGTGFGTFIPIFQSAESLEAVVPAITNHAHNDYLEIVLEGGLPAILLLGLFVAILAASLWRSARARRSREAGAVTVAATCGLVVLLVSSLVDYPLRMPALSATFAVLFSILLSNRSARSSASRDLAPLHHQSLRRSAQPSKAQWLLLLPLAGLALLAVQAAMASQALIDRSYASAAAWAPWSAAAHERLATELLLQGRLDEASEEADAAVALSPIDGAAIRTLGMVRLANGDLKAGERLMGLAIVLGWRDPLTQLWAVQRADASGETDKSLQRAEALFRQERAVLPAIVQLLHSSRPTVFPKLASMLAANPPWRDAFFEAAAGLPAGQVSAFTRLIAILARTSAPATPDELSPLLSQLVAAGKSEDARSLWNTARARGLVANGGFERTELRLRTPVPADWNIADQSRAKIDVVASPRGHVLRILGAKSSSWVLSQELMLRPGNYAVHYRGRASNAPAAAIKWELRCTDSPIRQSAEARLPGDGAWRQEGAVFTVPEQDCPIQTVVLRVVGGTPAAEILIDDVGIATDPR
jgi:O-antigen ligase